LLSKEIGTKDKGSWDARKVVEEGRKHTKTRKERNEGRKVGKKEERR
jgi:hypothetical protein